MFGFGPGEMFLLLVVALLLYGGDLPEKAREWGKILSDLRGNLTGIQNDLNTAIYSEPKRPQQLQHYPEFRDVEPIDGSTNSPATPAATGDAAAADSPDRPAAPAD